jgi:hypothetical protein
MCAQYLLPFNRVGLANNWTLQMRWNCAAAAIRRAAPELEDDGELDLAGEAHSASPDTSGQAERLASGGKSSRIHCGDWHSSWGSASGCCDCAPSPTKTKIRHQEHARVVALWPTLPRPVIPLRAS